MALCGFELLSAVATQGVKDVACQTLGMKPGRHVGGILHVSPNERHIVDALRPTTKGHNSEIPKLRGQLGLCKYFKRPGRRVIHPKLLLNSLPGSI